VFKSLTPQTPPSSMPEITVDEDHGAMSPQDDVGVAGKRTDMKSESEA